MDRDVGSGMFVGVLNNGRTQPSSVQALRCRLRSVCQGLQQGQGPDCFCAGTEMWAQEYMLGESNKAMTYTGSKPGM